MTDDQGNSSEVDLQVAAVAAVLLVRSLAEQGLGPTDVRMQHAVRAAAEAETRARRMRRRTHMLDARFRLSSSESCALWHLLSASLDTTVDQLLCAATLQPTATLEAVRRAVFGTRRTVEAARALGAEGTLRRLHLFLQPEREINEASERWRVCPRLETWLLGDDGVDMQLAGIAALLPKVPTNRILDTGCEKLLSEASAKSAVLVISGARGLGRRTALTSSAAMHGIDLLEVRCAGLSKDEAAFRRQLKLLARECLLLGRAPLIRNIDALVDGTDTSRVDLVGSELVAELDGPVFVTCGPQRPAIRWGRPTVVVEMKPPTSAQRAQLWLRELGQGTQEDAEYLATQYPLAPALIHHAAAAAKARANGKPLQPDDIYQGVRAVLDDRLGDYAKRVEVTQTWDDLVLADDQREAVQYLVARIRQRRTVYEQWGFAAKVGKGLGTSALFSGPPGTGKTMVAALVAKELGLELYQVDMAKVVSKFIGETERNLAALFDAAEAGHAVLLFDEADSLFGKRTEVKSSNDRYANLETNYLLQRLESFTGICLLTSNHEANIDPAFQRRLSLHVRFELPEADERAALWRAMLPAAAPVQPGTDFERLARSFVMSGGYIRNAALRAAFLAAEEVSAITGAHLERAARLEMEAMGRSDST
jgi:hypothetical protein